MSAIFLLTLIQNRLRKQEALKSKHESNAKRLKEEELISHRLEVEDTALRKAEKEKEEEEEAANKLMEARKKKREAEKEKRRRESQADKRESSTFDLLDMEFL